MIPNETLQTLETIGQTAHVTHVRMTEHTQARILVTLSDKMYTRKQLASVREYSTNAADEHVIRNLPIEKIEVKLPTMEDLNFRIRDFGDGLSETEVKDVYCVLGESTKRNDNRLNGVLGYGCKAGFASADSFIVTSWYNGQKAIYQFIKGDSTKLPDVIRLSIEDTTEPAGIEVCVPVKQSDWYTYHREAVAFYRNWPQMPTIQNLSDDDRETLMKWRNTPATLKGEGWEVRPKVDGNANAVAYMGWVPYQIDWNVLYHKMSLDSKSRALFELLRANDVILYFNMGEIQFVDSREHLEYTDKTINALVARIKEILSKIKDSIQEKFVGIANLWDAKIMYNSIFGTGLIEVEKGEGEVADVTERIKILDGNLMALENTFKGAFTWEGIVLDGSGWFDINRFDNACPDIQSIGHEPAAPVLVTYRKKKTRVKANRCTADKAERIMASTHTIVLINDTGRKHGQQMAARYLIHGHPKAYRTVYVLTFENQSLKDLFYKEMNFATVPVTYLSNIMPEAKKWNSANKVSRSYGGGGGGARPMMYMDIEQGTVESSEVPVREIEDGGYFLYAAEPTIHRYGRRRNRTTERSENVRGKDQYTTFGAEDVCGVLGTILEELDLDVERVYIINSKTADSKWFKEAIASKDWILLWDALDEAMPNLTVCIDHMVDAENYESTTKVSPEAAKRLVPKIMDKNSPLLSLIKTVGDKNFDMYVKIKDAFDGIGQWTTIKGEHKGTIDFDKAEEEAKKAYPYMDWNTLEYDSNATDENMTRVAKYVNAMDVYAFLSKGNTPVEETKLPEPKEAVAA
jgi:hypothetical protein